MIVLVIAIGIGLIGFILADAFETVVLPRRVPRQFRLGRFYFIATWRPWRAIAHALRGKRREYFLSIYGPLSVFGLLIVWAAGLVIGFGLIDTAIAWARPGPNTPQGLWTNLYFSGTTFFTLGTGDIVPHTMFGRIITVLESGTGFGFLAVVIGYLPVIYGAFARREVSIVLLDARAGSPPTAAELLRRHAGARGLDALEQLFHEWERWSADLLESHISYPVVAYFRSQHDNQSWLAALTAILDSTTVVIAGVDGACARQAKLTFAMARHAVVDLTQTFHATPRTPTVDRLPPADLTILRKSLAEVGLNFRGDAASDAKIAELRGMYEPYLNALAVHLFAPIPPWVHPHQVRENWRTSAWERISQGTHSSAAELSTDAHSD
jgi:hypothetical protein